MSVRGVALGDITETVMGQAPPGAACNKDGRGTVFVKAGEFSDIHPLVREWTTTPLKFAKQGDVLVCVVGATAGKINLGIDCAIGRSVAAVRPDPKRLDTGYLHYFLRTRTDRLREASQGLAQGVITREMLSKVEIPLPSLDEQQRIAAILDKADALRRQRKRALDLLDSLTQSIFRRTFVDEWPKSWPKHSVASLARDIRTGPFGSQLLHSEFVESGIAVLGIDNVVANEFRWGERRYISQEKYTQLRRYTVSPGDVLITIMGTCGRCAVVPDNIAIAINTKHLCCITLDKEKCLPEFLQATFLQHPDVLQQLGVQAKGAVMPGLNTGIIKSLLISLPPIDLQRAFATEILKLKGVLASSRAAEVKIDDLFSSLSRV